MRHLTDIKEPRHVVTIPSRAENAALYSCQPSLAALTQVFMEERADPDILVCVANPREKSVFEPFAYLVCSAYLQLRRATTATSIPPWRAMPAEKTLEVEGDK